MTPVNYPLKFSLASRTLFARTLTVIRWDAFEKASLANFHDTLPQWKASDLDGYLIYSVEVLEDCQDAISVRAGQLLYVMDTFPRYMTRLDGSFEDFLSGKSAKTRSTLRRKVRRFAEISSDQEIDWRTYETPVEIDEFFNHAIPLAQSTYQARLFDGALPSTDTFRQQAIRLAEQGKVRAYLLFLQGRPVAYLYTPLKGAGYVYDYLGYDREIAKMSPGTILQYLVLEKLFRDKPADYFDFTEGDGPHKALFATESKACCNVLYLDNTLRNRLLVRAHRFWNQGVAIAKRVLEKLNLSIGLKRAIQGANQER